MRKVLNIVQNLVAIEGFANTFCSQNYVFAHIQTPQCAVTARLEISIAATLDFVWATVYLLRCHYEPMRKIVSVFCHCVIANWFAMTDQIPWVNCLILEHTRKEGG